MKRGIFRIIAGAVLILLQIVSLIGQDPNPYNTSRNLSFYLGFFSFGITGIILLIFGCRACKNALYSKLVLHSKTSKIHTIIKWIGFVLSTLLFVYYLLSFIFNWKSFNVFTILNIFCTLSFLSYSLFYMYKKPSCLFSATLIFIGVSYIYAIINSFTFNLLYLLDSDYFVAYMFTGLIPRLIAGILYIVVAIILYKEVFYINVVKTLGWIVFFLELLNRVVCVIFVLKNFYFIDLINLIYLLFVTILMVNMSVLKINTLRETPVFPPVIENDNGFDYDTIMSIHIDPATVSKWQCHCGIVHPKYETSCICGKSKFDSINLPKANVNRPTINENISLHCDKILFCRKCGAKLNEESQFCHKCGTAIAKE